MLELAAEVLARGDAISMDPFRRKLTTHQVADILFVSEEHLARFLDEGRIPYTGTGKHRRVRVEDALALKEEWDQEREEGLNELIRMTEELGGYEKQEKLFKNQK